jgi:hypothetical protein
MSRKFKEGLEMSDKKLAEEKRKEIEQLATGWGRLLAQEAFPEGPGLDVSLADMEEIAAVATQAIVRGAIGTMAEEQARSLDEQHPCPACGKLCEIDRQPRTVAVRGGSVKLHEPVAHCSTCRRAFFPSTQSTAD